MNEWMNEWMREEEHLKLMNKWEQTNGLIDSWMNGGWWMDGLLCGWMEGMDEWIKELPSLHMGDLWLLMWATSLAICQMSKYLKIHGPHVGQIFIAHWEHYIKWGGSTENIICQIQEKVQKAQKPGIITGQLNIIDMMKESEQDQKHSRILQKNRNVIRIVPVK